MKNEKWDKTFGVTKNVLSYIKKLPKDFGQESEHPKEHQYESTSYRFSHLIFEYDHFLQPMF